MENDQLKKPVGVIISGGDQKMAEETKTSFPEEIAVEKLNQILRGLREQAKLVENNGHQPEIQQKLKELGDQFYHTFHQLPCSVFLISEFGRRVPLSPDCPLYLVLAELHMKFWPTSIPVCLYFEHDSPLWRFEVAKL